jgi:Arc/MetJ-type ribon-helix-helix transcriptional regulator
VAAYFLDTSTVLKRYVHIMTIHLTKELETNILAAVHSGRYASLDDAMCEAASLLIERLKQEQAQAQQPVAAPKHTPIWEEFEKIAASIPDEEWAKLPVDGAEQHDHYIYGTRKRPPSQ